MAEPFGAGRQGFTLAEGAALLLLEEASAAAARGARPLGIVRGHGATFDPARFAEPVAAAAAIARAIGIALADAGVAAAEIGLVVVSASGLPCSTAPRRWRSRRSSATPWRACLSWPPNAAWATPSAPAARSPPSPRWRRLDRGEAPAQPGLTLDPDAAGPPSHRGPGRHRLSARLGARPRHRRRGRRPGSGSRRARSRQGGRVSEQHVPLRLVPRFKDQGYDPESIARRRAWIEEKTGARMAGVGAVPSTARSCAAISRTRSARCRCRSARRVRCTCAAKRRTGSSTCRSPPPKARWCAPTNAAWRRSPGRAAPRRGSTSTRTGSRRSSTCADVASRRRLRPARLQLDFPAIKAAAEATTRHGKLRRLDCLPARPQDDRRPAVLDRRRRTA